MVDVSRKPVTRREARARARIQMTKKAAKALADGSVAKGDALAVARIAGIQAAKRTAEWVPLCHPLPLEHASISIQVDTEAGLATIESEVRAEARTGVEMEALVAAGAATFALYDMLKSVDRAMVIEEILVLEKHGGRSGSFKHPRVAHSRPAGSARP